MEKLRPILHKRTAKPTQPTSESRRFLPPVVGSKQWLVESTNTAEQIRRTQQPFRSVPQPPVKRMYGVERARLLNPIQVEQPPNINADFSFSFTGQRAERERKLRDSTMFDIDEQFMSDHDELSNTEAHQYQKIHNAERIIKRGQKGVRFYFTDDNQSISSTGSLGSVDEYTPESPQSLASLNTPTPQPPATPPQPRVNRNRMRNHMTHNTVGSTKRVQNGVTFYVTDDEQSICSTGSLGSMAVYTPESPRALPSQNTPTPEHAAALFKPTIYRSRMRNQEIHNAKRSIQSGQNGVTFYVTDDEQSISSTESLGSVDVYTPESPQALPALRTLIPKPPSTPPHPGMETNRMRKQKTHNTVGSTKRVQNGVTFYVTDDEQSISSTGSLGSVAVYTPESPRALPSQKTPTPEPPAPLFKPTIYRSRMRNQEIHRAVGTIKRGQKSMRFNISDDEQSIHSAESLSSVDEYLRSESPQALPALRTLTPKPPATPPQPGMKTNRMRKQATHNTVGSTKSVQKGVTSYVNFDEESGNSAGNQGTVGACSPALPQAQPARRTPTPEPPTAPFKPRVKRTRLGNQPGSSQGRNVAVNTRDNKPREQQMEQLKEQPLSREQPEWVLAQAFELLSADEWEQKVEGLQCVRTLAEHHKDILMPQLHDITPMLTKEVKNLRSAVSRAAMATLGHLYIHFNKSMDQYVKSTAGVLLHKAGEANKFIREEVELTLGNMVQNCSPGPVHNALLDTGLTHRNVAVRKCAALGLEKLAELMGPAQVLTGKSELTGNFLSGISKLALDPAQEVRSHARKVLKLLATQQNFMKMVEKYVLQKDKASIKDIVSK
ncbi:uncharacterized protein LOC134300068 [Trichomycterus rosablanca]|uniref:uncharacterized protein LOC134300068 n=1 Tax=Trichomycterus rosablanca TaxID=2290929 RepID=UPI002F3583B3